MIFRLTVCSKQMPGGGDVADFSIWSHSKRGHINKFTPDNGFLFSILVKELATNSRLLRALGLFDLFAKDYEWLPRGSSKEEARIKAVENFRFYFSAFTEEAPTLQPDDVLWISVLSLSKQKEILQILGKEYDPINKDERVGYEKFRAKLEPIPIEVLLERSRKILEKNA